MRVTTFAFAAAVVLAVMPPGSHGFARADSPPKLNVGQSCKAAARGAVVLGRDQEACMGDERAAQDTLAKNWPQYSVAHKTQCVAMTTQGGPSYVELISCLEIMRDAAAMEKTDPFTGVTGETPPRTAAIRRASRNIRPSGHGG
jgi:hypothetical protein